MKLIYVFAQKKTAHCICYSFLVNSCDAGCVHVIMADMRAADYSPSSFTHNQISALTQQATLHPQHKRNRMRVYGLCF